MREMMVFKKRDNHPTLVFYHATIVDDDASSP